MYFPGSLSDEVDQSAVQEELSKLKAEGLFENEEEFIVNPI